MFFTFLKDYLDGRYKVSGGRLVESDEPKPKVNRAETSKPEPEPTFTSIDDRVLWLRQRGRVGNPPWLTDSDDSFYARISRRLRWTEARKTAWVTSQFNDPGALKAYENNAGGLAEDAAVEALMVRLKAVDDVTSKHRIYDVPWHLDLNSSEKAWNAALDHWTIDRIESWMEERLTRVTDSTVAAAPKVVAEFAVRHVSTVDDYLTAGGVKPTTSLVDDFLAQCEADANFKPVVDVDATELSAEDESSAA